MTALADLPIFGICGHHESGKTTLIEQLLPRLLAQGISVAVAKVHGSRIEVDRPGKDSDRLYRAGADVFMQGKAEGGKAEGFSRTHASDEADPHLAASSHDRGVPRPACPAVFSPPAPLGEDRLPALLRRLARRYDLVLVEGRRRVGCDGVWLLGEGEREPPPDVGPHLAVLPREADRAAAAWGLLETWLPRQWLKTPVYGCVLIGGRSRRMGRPKHLLQQGGRSWVEGAVAAAAAVARRVVVVGAGEVPQALSGIARLPDAADAEGPMAGILAAMRWAPWASWLVSACDLPQVSAGALEWLLSTRRPGVWATLPSLPDGRGAEPLLAHYDFRVWAQLEELVAEGQFAPSALAGRPRVISPAPPAALQDAWINVNTPGDLG
jgi:molybdopterin-guanine dinucleotide biosynthesis protein A/molybdopterin-guanine dinucleotide biosynthesis protein